MIIGSKDFILLFCFSHLDFIVLQDYFTYFKPSQLLGGEKNRISVFGGIATIRQKTKKGADQTALHISAADHCLC